MFEFNNHQFFSFTQYGHVSNNNTDLVFCAVNLFNIAISRGQFARAKRWFTRTSGQLLDLNKIPGLHTRAQHFGGLRSVAIKKICGSLGRTKDFDCEFNPLDIRLRDRWQSVAIAHLHNSGLSPVELIQVGECYFVQDGHHRISVARALGQCAIDAEVTVWEFPTALPLEKAQWKDVQGKNVQPVYY